MTRILVTGGAGYIGAHVCKALAAAGLLPVTMDNLATGSRAAVRWGPLLEIDLADRADVEAALRRDRPAAVIHLAALTSVAGSMTDPGSYYAANLVNGLGLLDAMRAAGVATMVFSSTGAVYGRVETGPVAEGHPTRPINPYGEAKLAFERALSWYGQAHGLRWAALRYFNAAGADPAGEIGDARREAPNLLPAVLDACLGRRPGLTIFGTDYPTPDGTAIRDYIHVADLAEAHVATLRHLRGGGHNLVANLGTGTGHSVRAVLDAAIRITGRTPAVAAGPRRPGDPAEMVADATLARRALGWRPCRSDLDSLVETAWRWQQRRHAG